MAAAFCSRSTVSAETRESRKDPGTALILHYALCGHPDDPDRSYLTIRLITQHVRADGKVRETGSDVWYQVVVGPDDVTALRELAARGATPGC